MPNILFIEIENWNISHDKINKNRSPKNANHLNHHILINSQLYHDTSKWVITTSSYQSPTIGDMDPDCVSSSQLHNHCIGAVTPANHLSKGPRTVFTIMYKLVRVRYMSVEMIISFMEDKLGQRYKYLRLSYKNNSEIVLITV